MGTLFKNVLNVAGFLVLATGRAEEKRAPDVVVVYTDDWGYGDLGIYGNLKDIKTPNLDLLAQRGVLFTDGYVTSPQCGPSRAGLMTGRYNQRFGVDNLVDMPLPLDEVTLADRLKKGGYHTGMVGKWHLEPIVVSMKWALQYHPELIQGPHVRTPIEVQLPYFPQNRGFDEFFYGELHSYWANFSLDETPLPQEGKWVQDTRFRVDVQMEAGLRFLQNHIHGAKPVFLYLAPYAPHVPLEATEEYLKEFPGEMPERRRTGLAMMLAVDKGIGQIVDFLEKENRLDNTLFVFTSDNGAPLGAGQNAVMADVLPVDKAGPAWDGSRNDPLSGEKGMLAEGGVRVPMILSWPARLPKGKVVDEPVLTLDLVSSILAAVELDVPAQELDGIDLLPYLTGKEPRWPVRPIFWRFWSQSAVRLGDWKLIRVSDQIRMLFNLREDKEERYNLISTHSEKAVELGRLLDTWTTELPPAESAEMNHGERMVYQYYFPELGAVLLSEWDPGQSVITPINLTQDYMENTVGGGNQIFLNRYSLVDATTSKTSLDKAIKLDVANYAGGTGAGTMAFWDGLTSRTFEMWVNLGGSVPANTIMMETGSSNNGYGVKTTASGGLEFNHFNATNNTRASVSLTGLNLSDYIQIVAVVDATSKQFLLQVKDADGVSVSSGFISLAGTGSATVNQAGLGSAFGGEWRIPTGGGDTGGNNASLSAIANKFDGEIGLFRIYRTQTTAEADSNYTLVTTAPTGE